MTTNKEREFNFPSLAYQLGIRGFIAGNEYRAKCPLHQDKNPSWSMNIHTGLWVCFSGCGQGNFSRLVERVVECGPQEARDWVYQNGRATSVEQLSKNLALELGQHNQQIVPSQEYVGWKNYYGMLGNSVMPIWFLNRGFTWDTITHWGIRYDPIWDAVVVPVFWEGEMVGTITRHTKPDKLKYQNSPNLPKSEILFGEISEAKSEIILVEGCLDSPWLWQCGFNGAALLGHDLSAGQIGILKRFRYGEIILGLDNDAEGEKGKWAAVKGLTAAGWLLPQITVMRYPEGHKDPQDCTPGLLTDIYNGRIGVLEELT